MKLDKCQTNLEDPKEHICKSQPRQLPQNAISFPRFSSSNSTWPVQHQLDETEIPEVVLFSPLQNKVERSNIELKLQAMPINQNKCRSSVARGEGSKEMSIFKVRSS